MNRDLEALLKLWDEFIQTPKGLQAEDAFARYQKRLEAAAENANVSQDTINRAVQRYHARWVRANLPPGFPKQLGFE